MGRMVASTLKLGIAILNGGNSTVQQVLQCMATRFYYSTLPLTLHLPDI